MFEESNTYCIHDRGVPNDLLTYLLTYLKASEKNGDMTKFFHDRRFNFWQISELCSVEVVTRNESSLPVFFGSKVSCISLQKKFLTTIGGRKRRIHLRGIEILFYQCLEAYRRNRWQFKISINSSFSVQIRFTVTERKCFFRLFEREKETRWKWTRGLVRHKIRKEREGWLVAFAKNPALRVKPENASSFFKSRNQIGICSHAQPVWFSVSCVPF